MAGPGNQETRSSPGEALLARAWQEQSFPRDGLRTRCGRRVRVLHRGLHNGGRGPDFLGAAVALGGGQARGGDVEVHLRSSQWRAHGHHRDPHYDRVILHVVLLDDYPFPTFLHSGGEAPTLPLSLEPSSVAPQPPEPCRRARRSERGVGFLEEAGLARFGDKAALMEGEMDVEPPGQVLYQGLAEALGYARNKGPFRRLASSLPLGLLEGFLWGKPPARQEALSQAFLLGRAGLLPSQRGWLPEGGWPACLEDAWAEQGLEAELAVGDWELGVRVENHPVRRLVGLASLLARSLEGGLMEKALAPIGQGASAREWQEGLVQPALGYWRTHFDFGRVGHRLSPSLIGRGRALEMVANVVLPWAYAYGQRKGDPGLAQAALGAYRGLPPLGDNQVTRHMEEQLFGRRAPEVNTACLQQGLLHLFKAYCSQGKCSRCPANPCP